MNDINEPTKNKAALIPIVFLITVIIAVVNIFNVGEAPKSK